MLNHKQKVKLARRLSGKQSGHFMSIEWERHAERIEKEVNKKYESKQ